MLRGLRGRRIALAIAGTDADIDEQASTIRATLEEAGAQIDPLDAGRTRDQEWHGARYAGLVLVGNGSPEDPRLTQLVREFLLSEKPIAAVASASQLVRQAGGEPRVAGGDDTSAKDFAARVVADFSDCLEDRDLDEVSEESFPASDPPATSPISTTPVVPEPRSETR